MRSPIRKVIETIIVDVMVHQTITGISEINPLNCIGMILFNTNNGMIHVNNPKIGTNANSTIKTEATVI